MESPPEEDSGALENVSVAILDTHFEAEERERLSKAAISAGKVSSTLKALGGVYHPLKTTDLTFSAFYDSRSDIHGTIEGRRARNGP
jgi:hypothetical protein